MKPLRYLLISSLVAAVGCVPTDEAEIGELPENMGIALVDFGDGAKEVVFEDVEGLALIEGDIILGTVDEVLSRTRRFNFEMGNGPVAVGATSTSLWPHGVVRYRLDPGLSASLTDAIEDVITEWNETTFIQLIEDDGQGVGGHHVYVTGYPLNEAVGAAAIGYSPPFIPWPKWQELRLGGATGHGTVRHEFGHTIGLFHEQSRLDRDDHVEIFDENIQYGSGFNFSKHNNGGIDTGDYNTASVMHYDSDALAVDSAFPTIVAKGCPYWPLGSLSDGCKVGGSAIQESDKRSILRAYAGAAVRLKNAASHRCLSIFEGVSVTRGPDPVYTTGCTSDQKQKWHLLLRANVDGGPVGNTHQVVNAKTLKCLTRNGDHFIQSNCDGSAAQRFKIPAAGGGINLKTDDGAGCVQQVRYRRGYREKVRFSTSCSGTERQWNKLLP